MNKSYLRWSTLSLQYVCVFMDALQMELKECRLMLAEERRARLNAESKSTEVIIVVIML